MKLRIAICQFPVSCNITSNAKFIRRLMKKAAEREAHAVYFPDLFEAYRKKDVQLIFHSCHTVSRKPRPLFEELTLAQIRTRATDNQMWIAGSTSSARYSFSKTCIARPD